MSPILKRDVAETVRQARRLAAAAGLRDYDEYAEYELDPVGVSRVEREQRERSERDRERERPLDRDSSTRDTASTSSTLAGPSTSTTGSTTTSPRDTRKADTAYRISRSPGSSLRRASVASSHAYPPRAVRDRDTAAAQPLLGRTSEDGSEASVSDVSTGSAGSAEGKWHDLMGLLFSSTPSLMFALIGLVFSGQLLEHCARWRVFRRVDELFILFPMIGNLKGNLEMCLSARLGTSASLGELDRRRPRRTLIVANLTLLGLQALLISCLAALISFALGLVTIHRLGDQPAGEGLPANDTVADPTLSDPWREGRTRPGAQQLVMVLATGMGAAGISSLSLGSFMSSLVVACRWHGVDPDNITPPVAACLGDLVTLFILALVGTALVGAMDTLVPLIAVALMSAAAVWFTRRVMRDGWVRDIARGSWLPLIVAMLISSGTGMVLESGVGKYKGFALLAISMTGLTGSIGAIHANRLSTNLHAGLHSGSKSSIRRVLSPGQSVAVLFLLSLPVQGAFLLFVNVTGWIDVSLGWTGWVAYALTAAFSLVSAHYMTLFCWSKDLDPDSYTLPVHSAIVDFVGQLLLMLAYEVCRMTGNTSVMSVPE